MQWASTSRRQWQAARREKLWNWANVENYRSCKLSIFARLWRWRAKAFPQVTRSGRKWRLRSCGPPLAIARGDFPKSPFRLPGIKREFKISGADWKRIESGYKHQLAHAVRTKLLDATRGFIYWDEFEGRAEPLAETKKHLEVYEKAARNLGNALWPISRARTQVGTP